MKRVRILAVLLALLLTGCGALGPSVPAADDWTTQAAAPSQAAGPAAGQARVAVVSPARQALTATLGIQVYWNSAGTAAGQEADANRIFNYVVSLGANSVGINFFFYTNGVTPAYVYGVPGSTPSPATIAMVASIAREHGLRVLIRPLLNEANLIDSTGDWRGSIRPPSVDVWFSSYWAFLKPYLAAARRAKATAFDIGAELDSLAPDSYNWTAFKAAAAQVFPGALDYAVNYGRWQEVPSYEPVPDAAVDAYPELGLGDDATVTELTSAWISWLRTQPQSVLRGTVLQEVAIAAVAGAYTEPAKTYPIGTPLDIEVQRKWFAAACAAAKRAGLAGLYFYDVNSTDRPNDNALTAAYSPGSFIDRSADQIRACFASGWH